MLSGSGQIEEAAGQSGDGACNHHGHDDAFLLIDAGVLTGIAVEANRLQLITEGGLV